MKNSPPQTPTWRVTGQIYFSYKTQCFYGDETRTGEYVGACISRSGRKKCLQNFSREIRKEDAVP